MLGHGGSHFNISNQYSKNKNYTRAVELHFPTGEFCVTYTNRITRFANLWILIGTLLHSPK